MSDENEPKDEEQADAGTPEDAAGGSVDDDWAAAMEESGDADNSDGDDENAGGADSPFGQLESDATEGEGEGPGPELDVILDIPVRISMEVGCTQIPIRNLLQLNQGSVVELDRLAGEPLDVMVNGTLIAHGEVVMVNDKFGIRLTDVVSQSERINRLR